MSTDDKIEYGLHNLMPENQRAMRLNQLLMAHLAKEYVGQPIDSTGCTVHSLSSELHSWVIQNYNVDTATVKFKIILHSGSGVLSLVPLTLTSLIILYGMDMPPVGLNYCGRYTSDKFLYELDWPVDSTDPIITIKDV